LREWYVNQKAGFNLVSDEWEKACATKKDDDKKGGHREPALKPGDWSLGWQSIL